MTGTTTAKEDPTEDEVATALTSLNGAIDGLVTKEDAQFVFDVNRIEGEGNMSEKLAELGHDDFDAAANKGEVAKLFILNRPDDGFTDKAAIEKEIGAAVTEYNTLLNNVNEADELEEMTAALGDIATRFDIQVNAAMAQTALNQKADGYGSVAEIIEAIQEITEVSTLDELKDALADEAVQTIAVTSDIETSEEIIVDRAVAIYGGDNTISFTGNTDGWQGSYVLQVYKATGVTINDITLSGADGALLVNGSDVTLTGNIDVSGNEFGGIEVSKGENVENDPVLDVTRATLSNTDEAYGLPTIWEDGVTDKVTATDGQLTTNDSVKEDQVQYYLKATNSEGPEAPATT